jgi:hypothetical protein
MAIEKVKTAQRAAQPTVTSMVQLQTCEEFSQRQAPD